MWTELVRKIELQSVLVLFIALLFGFLLLNKDNSLSTPAGILGSISIGFGILYTFGSFFSNQIKESYKDVIREYKSTISILRSSNKDAQNYYKDTLTGSEKNKTVGEYRIAGSIENETEKE